MYFFAMNFGILNFRNFFVASLSALCLANAATDKQTPPGDFYDEVSRLNKVLSEVNRKCKSVRRIKRSESLESAHGFA